MATKNKTPAEVETVTVTMSRPVAEAVMTACEMYLRLHMGQFEGLTDDLCMTEHFEKRTAGKFKDEKEASDDFYKTLKKRDEMRDEMNRAYRLFACHPLIEDGMCIPYRAEQVWLGIRHALAWHDRPEGDWSSVQFDPPLNRSDQPMPKVELQLKGGKK